MKEAIKTLLDTDNEAIITFTKRDLLGEEVNIEELWTLPRVKKILKKQQPNGSWIYPNKKAILRSRARTHTICLSKEYFIQNRARITKVTKQPVCMQLRKMHAQVRRPTAICYMQEFGFNQYWRKSKNDSDRKY